MHTNIRRIKTTIPLIPLGSFLQYSFPIDHHAMPNFLFPLRIEEADPIAERIGLREMNLGRKNTFLQCKIQAFNSCQMKRGIGAHVKALRQQWVQNSKQRSCSCKKSHDSISFPHLSIRIHSPFSLRFLRINVCYYKILLFLMHIHFRSIQ